MIALLGETTAQWQERLPVGSEVMCSNPNRGGIFVKSISSLNEYRGTLWGEVRKEIIMTASPLQRRLVNYNYDISIALNIGR